MATRPSDSDRGPIMLAGPCRWQRRPEERRPEILAAARAVFAEVGFTRATLAEVAKKAGVSPATISHYFGSKAALFQEMIAERAFDLATDDVALLVVDGGCRKALHRLVDEEWRRLNAPGTAGLMLTVLRQMEEFPQSAQQLLRQLCERSRRRMAQVIEAGVKEGEFGMVDPMMTSHVIGSLLLGATLDLQYISACMTETTCRDEAYTALLAAVDRLVQPVAPTVTQSRSQADNATQ